jgi:hypothetical protein
MVVAGRNPAGVLSGQRLPCHSVFSYPAIQCLAILFFVLNPIPVRFPAQNKFTILIL